MVKRMLIEKRKRQRESKRKAGTEIETQRQRKIGSTKQKLLVNIFVDEGLSLSLMLKKKLTSLKMNIFSYGNSLYRMEMYGLILLK